MNCSFIGNFMLLMRVLLPLFVVFASWPISTTACCSLIASCAILAPLLVIKLVHSCSKPLMLLLLFHSTCKAHSQHCQKDCQRLLLLNIQLRFVFF